MMALFSEKYDSTIDTMLHKENVKKYLGQFISDMTKRADCHDDSKLISPEKELYDKYIPLLKQYKYGTKEYIQVRQDMIKDGGDHHNKVNRHHPEHFKNGIQDMTLHDIIELFFDWYAASLRSDTNFEDGLKINKEKYQFSDQLCQLMLNTYNEYLK